MMEDGSIMPRLILGTRRHELDNICEESIRGQAGLWIMLRMWSRQFGHLYLGQLLNQEF